MASSVRSGCGWEPVAACGLDEAGGAGRETGIADQFGAQQDLLGEYRPFAIVLRRAQHQVARQAGRGGESFDPCYGLIHSTDRGQAVGGVLLQITTPPALRERVGTGGRVGGGGCVGGGWGGGP